MVLHDNDDDDGDLDKQFANPITAEMEKLSKELPIEIDRLHNEYNKFFGGAEKRPPIKLREQLEKRAERLKQIMKQSNSVGTSMRIQNAVIKFNTYIAMWDKRMIKFEQTGSSI